MIESGKKISVVVRTKGLEKTPALLDALSRQTCQPSEIIVVNNAERLNLPRTREVRISDKEFSHMYSTNLGVSLAYNEFVCITNGHSLPVDSKWLENGLASMHPKVAGVSGSFLPQSLIKHLYSTTERLLAMLIRSWGFTTINCMIRKSLWNQYPFDEGLLKLFPQSRVLGGEDCDWSLEMRARGHRILFNPRFAVFHSHCSDWRTETNRNIQAYFKYRKLVNRLEHLARPRESFTQVRV